MRQLGIQKCVCCCRNSGHSGGDSSADGRLPHDELPHDEADSMMRMIESMRSSDHGCLVISSYEDISIYLRDTRSKPHV